MKNWKFQWALVAIFSLSMFGFVACGDDDDDTNEQKENLNEQNKDEYSASDDHKNVDTQYTPIIEDLDAIIKSRYEYLADFVKDQLYLEGLRVNDPTKVHTITPDFQALHDVWMMAYTTVNMVNKIIQFIPSVQQTNPTFTAEQAKVYLAHAKCLRAFSHYNLAMLWGNVYIITEQITSTNEAINLERSSQEEVYQAAYTDIKEAVSNFPASGTGLEDDSWFTRDAALMLKAEIELTLGLLTDAQTTLSSVSNNVLLELPLSKPIADPNYSNIVSIYTPYHLNLFKQEAQGNQDGLAADWKTLPATQYGTWVARYGYWAALKRLGKAQEVTGCYDYELLMPFFAADLVENVAGQEQNPGY